MSSTTTTPSRRAWLAAWLVSSLLAFAGCATMLDPLRIDVAGVDPVPGNGLELRFAVKLRVQNPNDFGIDFDGVAVDLEVNGKNLASGVSDQKGTVPRFGEALITVPVTVSAYAAVRQLLGLSDAQAKGELPYLVRGKLAGGPFGSVRFSHSGTLKLPQSARAPAAPSGG